MKPFAPPICNFEKAGKSPAFFIIVQFPHRNRLKCLLRRQIGVQSFQQFAQKIGIIDIIDQQHIFRARVRRFVSRFGHQAFCRFCRLDQKPVVVNAADDFSFEKALFRGLCFKNSWIQKSRGCFSTVSAFPLKIPWRPPRPSASEYGAKPTFSTACFYRPAILPCACRIW